MRICPSNPWVDIESKWVPVIRTRQFGQLRAPEDSDCGTTSALLQNVKWHRCCKLARSRGVIDPLRYSRDSCCTTKKQSYRLAALNHDNPSSLLICSPSLTYSSRHSGFLNVAGLIDSTGAPLMTFLIGTTLQLALFHYLNPGRA